MCVCCNNHNLNNTVDRFSFFRSHRQRGGDHLFFSSFTKVRHCGTFCFLVLVYDHVHLVLASSSSKPNNYDPIKNKIHWSRRPQFHIAIDIAIDSYASAGEYNNDIKWTWNPPVYGTTALSSCVRASLSSLLLSTLEWFGIISIADFILYGWGTRYATKELSTPRIGHREVHCLTAN